MADLHGSETKNAEGDPSAYVEIQRFSFQESRRPRGETGQENQTKETEE
jgi:hypothetical protein